MTDIVEYHFEIRPAYNTSADAGSDSIAAGSVYYYNGADIAWMMTSAALVFVMISGVSLLHAGLSETRSAMSVFRLPALTTAVVGCQWFLFGYSLAFSSRADDTTWTFWGGTSGLLFHDVAFAPVGNESGAKIPELVYAFYQMMFACFTASLVTGAAYRKFPTAQFLVFIFLWTTLVYDPIARWSWHPQGWLKRSGSLDFAGGTVVHISAGAAVHAFAVFYGLKIRFFSKTKDERLRLRKLHLEESAPHDLNFVVLGTALIWFGWFGFNGGSALGANTRAASACVVTQISACFGAITGLFIYWLNKSLRWARSKSPDKRFKEGKGSATKSFCDGAIAGLVAITPAAGYVPAHFAPIFGVVASVSVVIVMTVVKTISLFNAKHTWLDIVLLQYDVLAVGILHAGSGIVGMCLTAFLNRPEVFALDGFSKPPNGADQLGLQLGRQLKDASVGYFYSFGVTLAILVVFASIKRAVPSWWKDEENLEVLEHRYELTEVQRRTSLSVIEA